MLGKILNLTMFLGSRGYGDHFEKPVRCICSMIIERS